MLGVNTSIRSIILKRKEIMAIQYQWASSGMSLSPAFIKNNDTPEAALIEALT